MINVKIFDGLHGFETPKENKHPFFYKVDKEIKIFDGLHGFETPESVFENTNNKINLEMEK